LPAILPAFQAPFLLDAELLNVKLASTIVTENALFLNLSNPCKASQECIIMGPEGSSCSSACAALGRICNAPRIAFFNTCQIMTQVTVCAKGCFVDQGRDLPSVPMKGPQSLQCLVNKWQPICNGRYPFSRRLCSCVESSS
jgi:hypothetical protein